jgi:hypothetical protein
VNLLTYSEQFDNAAWSKLGAGTGSVPVVTANAAVAPDGTMTADRIDFNRGAGNLTSDQSSIAQNQAVVMTAGIQYTARFYVKAATGGDIGKIMSYRTVAGAAYSNVTLTDAWRLVTLTATSAAVQLLLELISRGTAGSDNSFSALVWGADVRVTNDGVGIPAYQRINAATDYDTTGFPLFLNFDGVDDSLATASINFSATDKMSVFAGVRKLSDAAVGSVVELSANVNTNSGSFWVAAPVTVTGPNYYFVSRGTTAPAGSIASGNASPTTNVITGLGDIVAPNANIRVNASQIVTDTTTQGTGNFGNYPLYIGMRGGATVPFNGRIYSLIVRGATTTADQIARTEAWVNNITKAY